MSIEYFRTSWGIDHVQHESNVRDALNPNAAIPQCVENSNVRNGKSDKRWYPCIGSRSCK